MSADSRRNVALSLSASLSLSNSYGQTGQPLINGFSIFLLTIPGLNINVINILRTTWQRGCILIGLFCFLCWRPLLGYPHAPSHLILQLHKPPRSSWQPSISPRMLRHCSVNVVTSLMITKQRYITKLRSLVPNTPFLIILLFLKLHLWLYYHRVNYQLGLFVRPILSEQGILLNVLNLNLIKSSQSGHPLQIFKHV